LTNKNKKGKYMNETYKEIDLEASADVALDSALGEPQEVLVDFIPSSEDFGETVAPV
jgi:hypothetical protein